MASSGYALCADRLRWLTRRSGTETRHASVVEIEANLLESLRDFGSFGPGKRPDRCGRKGPLEGYAGVRHKLRTRGRGLRIDDSHANLPGSSDDAVLINPSDAICNFRRTRGANSRGP